ncbi:hypothetical protein BVRB_027350 [Beta vulgaris subsp. vulgaris]|uniref:Uncharacterized protein n=1 Tax=Beta vulgaris subsp. vulgaris TaxID=3555 RepID=A0A0J8B1S5_BETVV|nr:hypothetical protein BVRB_027350 [Beta vulgaris subsp. vulgaris]
MAALADYFYVLSSRVRERAADAAVKPALIQRYIHDSEKKILERLRYESRKIDEFLHDSKKQPPEFIHSNEIYVLTDELDPRLAGDWDARRQISAQLYDFMRDRLGFHRSNIEPSSLMSYFRITIPMHAELCRTQTQAIKNRFAQKSGLPNDIDPLLL